MDEEEYEKLIKSLRQLFVAANSGDNPDYDSTDFAHPAWHRGFVYGVEKVTNLLRKLFSTTEEAQPVRTIDYRKFNQLFEMLFLLKNRAQKLERVVNAYQKCGYQPSVWATPAIYDENQEELRLAIFALISCKSLNELCLPFVGTELEKYDD